VEKVNKDSDSQNKEKANGVEGENEEKEYTLKVCPTELYGDKLIKILEEEFEKEKKKKD
jgi:hypothetical protein